MMNKALVLASAAVAAGLGFASQAFAQQNPPGFEQPVRPDGGGVNSHGGSMLPPHERARMNAIREHYANEARAHEEYRQRIRDWQSYGLYAPPRGYSWYRYDDDRYALVQQSNGKVARVIRHR